QIPALQLLEADADVRARECERCCDVFRRQRLGGKEQQRVDLGDGSTHTPAARHLAPVKNTALHRRCERHRHSRLVRLSVQVFLKVRTTTWAVNPCYPQTGGIP